VILADTGILYALIDADDEWHQRVVEWWGAASEPVLVPVTVLPEVTYLLHQRISPLAEVAFVEAVVRGEFSVEPLEAEDMTRAAAVMAEYADLGLGFVDATIVAIAERLRVRTVATTDRRHFSAVRPRHVRALVLAP
jgi:predicted nucleic acid-binding protein